LLICLSSPGCPPDTVRPNLSVDNLFCKYGSGPSDVYYAGDVSQGEHVAFQYLELAASSIAAKQPDGQWIPHRSVAQGTGPFDSGRQIRPKDESEAASHPECYTALIFELKGGFSGSRN